MYYNTTDLTGQDLLNAYYRAGCQTRRIASYFQIRNALFTPFEILDLYSKDYARCPITSIRRSITDLTKIGYLEKTNHKRNGDYGQPNYCWKLKTVGYPVDSNGQMSIL